MRASALLALLLLVSRFLAAQPPPEYIKTAPPAPLEPLPTSDPGASFTSPCEGHFADLSSDRFTKSITIAAQGDRLAGFEPHLTWTDSAPGKLHFFVEWGGKEWKYVNCPVLYVLADDEPITVAAVEHFGEVHPGFVIEGLSGTILWDLDAKKLRDVRRFEYKLCNDAFQASPSFACEVRDLIRKAEGYRAPVPAPAKKKKKK